MYILADKLIISLKTCSRMEIRMTHFRRQAMKTGRIFATIALVALTSCCTTVKLSPQDRALLTETQMIARQSASQSAQALAEAKAARESAEKAALEAQNSSKKSDRIFRAAQQK
jgi:hypothetical protein